MSAELADQAMTSRLCAGGRTAEDAAAIVGGLNLSRFLVDGQPDTVAINTWADKYAPAPPSARRRNFGAGQRETQTAREGEGKAQARKRFGDRDAVERAKVDATFKSTEAAKRFGGTAASRADAAAASARTEATR